MSPPPTRNGGPPPRGTATAKTSLRQDADGSQDNAGDGRNGTVSAPHIERDLDAVAAWLTPIAAAGGAHLPILGSPEWVTAGDATRTASAAGFLLMVIDELDPVVIAARLLAEAAAGRRRRAQRHKAAALDVHSAADWPALIRDHNRYQRDTLPRRATFGGTA